MTQVKTKQAKSACSSFYRVCLSTAIQARLVTQFHILFKINCHIGHGFSSWFIINFARFSEHCKKTADNSSNMDTTLSLIEPPYSLQFYTQNIVQMSGLSRPILKNLGVLGFLKNLKNLKS